MNRLVIIGNGYDLAHIVQTSYSDHIDKYWRKASDTKGSKKTDYKDNFVALTCVLGRITTH